MPRLILELDSEMTTAISNKENYARHADYIRRELQVAFDQIDRGEISDLDMSAILAEAHRRYAANDRHSPNSESR